MNQRRRKLNYLEQISLHKDGNENRFKVRLEPGERSIYRRRHWVWSTWATLQMVERELKARSNGKGWRNG